MKISRATVLHADGGLKTLSFLKVETDAGIAGWAEFSEFTGSEGLGQIISRLASDLVGEDPRNLTYIHSRLRSRSRLTSGGLSAQACAAIENACLDIKAKALGVPVCELLGGAARDRVKVYWSHCGTYRILDSDLFGAAPVRSLGDMEKIGAEVAAQGFSALKTNIILFDQKEIETYSPGFRPGYGFPQRMTDEAVLRAAVDQMEALRAGAGPDVRLILDANFDFRPDGMKRLARVMEPFDLTWLELDHVNPDVLAMVRNATSTPIGSLEAIYHRTGYRPYFEKGAVDMAIVDPMWNGVMESVKIADMADAYDLPVSAHGFTSELGLMMSVHFCAAIPNYGYVEMDVDQPAWVSGYYKGTVTVKDGMIDVPKAPGWGIEVDEAALQERPPRGATGWLRSA